MIKTQLLLKSARDLKPINIYEGTRLANQLIIGGQVLSMNSKEPTTIVGSKE